MNQRGLLSIGRIRSSPSLSLSLSVSLCLSLAYAFPLALSIYRDLRGSRENLDAGSGRMLFVGLQGERMGGGREIETNAIQRPLKN